MMLLQPGTGSDSGGAWLLPRISSVGSKFQVCICRVQLQNVIPFPPSHLSELRYG